MARPGYMGRGGLFGIFIDPASLAKPTKAVMRSRNAVLDAAQATFTRITHKIKNESQRIVPQKTGKLQRSFYRFVNRRAWTVDAEAGYDRHGQISYAWERHQKRAKNYTTAGTDYLYLVRAWDRYADDIAKTIARAARKRFDSRGYARSGALMIGEQELDEGEE